MTLSGIEPVTFQLVAQYIQEDMGLYLSPQTLHPGTNNRQSHTINTRYCYLLKITVSTELHVSAHESHHQAYKYSTIKMENVQLLAGLYIEISCMSQS